MSSVGLLIMTGCLVVDVHSADETDPPTATESVAVDRDDEYFATGISLEPGAYDSAYVFEDLDEKGFEAYVDALEQSFIRPGLMNSSDRLVPSTTAQRLARGFRTSFEAGFGYDSNTLLSNGGYSSPTHPDRGHEGGGVSWFRVNLGYSSGTELDDGRKLFYGFDIGGDVISYDSGYNADGRGNAEPYISPYIGIRGAKTTVRLGTSYYLKQGNFLFGSDSPREAPTAESETWGGNLSVTRRFDHGTGSYVFDYRTIDFETDTNLNDQDSGIHDLSYLHNPPSMPKTGLGAGIRFGNYTTTANPDEDFFEPSFRASYAASAKTTFDGRVGYMFRDYSGPTAISSDGRMSYAIGTNWAASERVGLRLSAYRDSSPSYVSAGESYNTDGLELRANYASPFWRLHFETHVAFEMAEYYSTVVGGNATRNDDYFSWGISAGRPVNLVHWMDTSISLFYDFTANNSIDFQADYDRHFTGFRLTGSL